MKYGLVVLCFCGLLGLDSVLAKGWVMGQKITKKGSLRSFNGDSKIFSGEVKVDMLFSANKWRNFSGGLVRFSPKARSAWHTHPAGQTLLVTQGTIYTGTKEGMIGIAHEGDVISCPPNVEHWHGAGIESSGTHIALTPEKDGVNVVWGEKLSDEEYLLAIANAKEK